MIESKHFGFRNTYAVSCDQCSYGETIEADSWSEMIAAIREKGWRNRKNRKGDWEQSCPCCSGVAP